MPQKCRICDKNAILKRPKTGDALCRECFFLAFEEEVHHTITSANLFSPGEIVAIGASGGKDSTVLAHTVKLLNERHKYGLRLILLSVDEGITGYRDDSLETVKRNQQQYDLPLTIVSYEELYGWTMDAIVKQIGLKNNCTFCGVFRRQALDRGAMKVGANKIVTGHNADDIAETVIMNVLRGDIARLKRCTAITTGAEGCLPRCKPFKYTYEKEIVMYAYFKKLDYFSTECIYSPNAYRGFARTYIKDLEKIRPSSIIDIIHSGECMSVKEDVKMPKQTVCQRCNFVSSNDICKACVMLEGLNQGRPRLGIGKIHKERRKWEEELKLKAESSKEEKQANNLTEKMCTVNGCVNRRSQCSGKSACGQRSGQDEYDDLYAESPCGAGNGPVEGVADEEDSEYESEDEEVDGTERAVGEDLSAFLRESFATGSATSPGITVFSDKSEGVKNSDTANQSTNTDSTSQSTSTDKPDSTTQSTSTDKPDSTNQSTSTDKPDSTSRSSGTDKRDSTTQSTNTVQPDSTNQSTSTDQPDSTNRSTNTDKPNSTNQSTSTDVISQPSHMDKPYGTDRSTCTDKPDGNTRSTSIEKTAGTDRSTSTEPSDGVNKATHTDQCGRIHQSTCTYTRERANQSTLTEKPDGSNKSTGTDKCYGTDQSTCTDKQVESVKSETAEACDGTDKADKSTATVKLNGTDQCPCTDRPDDANKSTVTDKVGGTDQSTITDMISSADQSTCTAGYSADQSTSTDKLDSNDQSVSTEECDSTDQSTWTDEPTGANKSTNTDQQNDDSQTTVAQEAKIRERSAYAYKLHGTDRSTSTDKPDDTDRSTSTDQPDSTDRFTCTEAPDNTDSSTCTDRLTGKDSSTCTNAPDVTHQSTVTDQAVGTDISTVTEVPYESHKSTCTE
ncbi:cytosolic thiouridylase subunit Ctu1 [Bulinus truncatus]|nr:cytosolic thiouridylase subunit Ctu1 [Bulinus truncatus]